MAAVLLLLLVKEGIQEILETATILFIQKKGMFGE